MRARATRGGGISAGGRGLWTPERLPSLALWLDASDASTFTLVSNAVSEWRDKSGNNRHVSQATAANRPAYSATSFNGRPGLTFNGTNSILENLNAALLRNVAGATLIGVSCRSANLASEAIAFFVNGNTGVRAINTYRSAGFNNTGVGFGGRRLNTDAFQGIGETPANTDYAINIGVYNYAGASLTAFEQGVQTGTRVFQTSGNTPNDFGAFFVGSNTTLTAPLNGEIGEIIICHAALSATDRQRLEGFLAHKYWGAGTANPLPASHLFKNQPPRL